MAQANELRHVAVILDGNGRWAAQHGVERKEGHMAGANRVVDFLNYISRYESIRYVTLYAFSTENWNRSEEEVSALMDLLCVFLDEYGPELVKNRVRLLVSGRQDRIPEKAQTAHDLQGIHQTFHGKLPVKFLMKIRQFLHEFRKASAHVVTERSGEQTQLASAVFCDWHDKFPDIFPALFPVGGRILPDTGVRKLHAIPDTGVIPCPVIESAFPAVRTLMPPSAGHQMVKKSL